jgi:hypothetical protein
MSATWSQISHCYFRLSVSVLTIASSDTPVFVTTAAQTEKTTQSANTVHETMTTCSHGRNLFSLLSTVKRCRLDWL